MSEARRISSDGGELEMGSANKVLFIRDLTPRDQEYEELLCQSGRFFKRRVAVRHELALPLEIWPQSNSPDPICTLTTDISAYGLAFNSNHNFQLGEKFKFEITFPCEDKEEPETLIRGIATTLRVGKTPQQVLRPTIVGATIDSYEVWEIAPRSKEFVLLKCLEPSYRTGSERSYQHRSCKHCN
jgi:hypothetical protein